MFKEKIFGFLKLTRFGVSLFGCVSLFVSGILAGDLKGFQFEYLFAFLIVIISGSGAFAINDYFDYEVDQINDRQDRPIVLGLISRRTALITAIISFISVVILSTLLNLISLILIYTNILIYYLYSVLLKKHLFIKNILIALSYSSTILLGTFVIDSHLEPLITYFAIMGFIVGLANEIMFDIADVKGDKEKDIKTIATEFGVKKAAQISAILYVIIIVLDPLPYVLKIDQKLYLDYMFLFLILIPVIMYSLLLISLLKNQTRKNIIKLRIRVFIIMQIGTISYLLGVLI